MTPTELLSALRKVQEYFALLIAEHPVVMNGDSNYVSPLDEAKQARALLPQIIAKFEEWQVRVDEEAICKTVMRWLQEGEDQYDNPKVINPSKAHPNTLRGYIQIVGWVRRDLRVCLDRALAQLKERTPLPLPPSSPQVGRLLLAATAALNHLGKDFPSNDVDEPIYLELKAAIAAIQDASPSPDRIVKSEAEDCKAQPEPPALGKAEFIRIAKDAMTYGIEASRRANASLMVDALWPYLQRQPEPQEIGEDEAVQLLTRAISDAAHERPWDTLKATSPLTADAEKRRAIGAFRALSEHCTITRKEKP